MPKMFFLNRIKLRLIKQPEIEIFFSFFILILSIRMKKHYYIYLNILDKIKNIPPAKHKYSLHKFDKHSISFIFLKLSFTICKELQNLFHLISYICFSGCWMYSASSCCCFKKIRTHKSRKARAQFHDGYSANKEGEYRIT
jgi:hypothetical protein